MNYGRHQTIKINNEKIQILIDRMNSCFSFKLCLTLHYSVIYISTWKLKVIINLSVLSICWQQRIHKVLVLPLECERNTLAFNSHLQVWSPSTGRDNEGHKMVKMLGSRGNNVSCTLWIEIDLKGAKI